MSETLAAIGVSRAFHRRRACCTLTVLVAAPEDAEPMAQETRDRSHDHIMTFRDAKGEAFEHDPIYQLGI